MNRRTVRLVVDLIAATIVAIVVLVYLKIDPVALPGPSKRPVNPRDPKVVLTAKTPVVFGRGPIGQELAAHCPVEGDDRIWEPDLQVIRTAERALEPLLASGRLPLGVTSLSGYLRQYVGVFENGRQLVCLSASTTDMLKSTEISCASGQVPDPAGCYSDWWRRAVIWVNDGGDAFWRILYDPTTGEFSSFEANGVG